MNLKPISKGVFLQSFFAALIFLIGVAIGYFIPKVSPPGLIENVREESSNYKFINPLLFVKVPEEQSFPEYIPLKDAISKYTNQALGENKVSDVSVYFRNLNSSKWISINPAETFSPASMLKVLTLISVLRVAESDPSLLSKKITLKGPDAELVESQVRYSVKNPVRSGETYSVEDLLYHLTVESDNVANAALINLIGSEKIEKTYDDLQLPKPDPEREGGYTVEEYSHLFRALYNGTYLSRSLSEHVLDLLSMTTFNQGIVAGVPKGTLVSHKFGVKTTLSSDSAKATPSISYRELHDCGIVYYPKNPYFVCIMTRGSDFDVLESVIKDISSIVWNHL